MRINDIGALALLTRRQTRAQKNDVRLLELELYVRLNRTTDTLSIEPPIQKVKESELSREPKLITYTVCDKSALTS